jgi:hypothetical protein
MHNVEHKASRIAGGAFFLLGVLTTMTLAGVTAWAAFEGLSYFATGAGYDLYGGMHCPILISPRETGIVSASFSNPTDQVLQPYYEVEISGRIAARQFEGQIAVPPHTSQSVTWTVNAGDIDLEPFIFAKMDVLPVGGHGTREATCGILVWDVAGMSGIQAVSVGIGIALLLILAGLVVPTVGLTPGQANRFDNEASSNARRASQALGVASASALFAGLMGWWLPAMLLLAVSLLLLVMVLPYVISGG